MTRMRLPHATARLRLTALYGGLFLVSGVVLLASTYVLFERATAVSAPRLPKVPHAPAITPLQQAQLPPSMLYATGAGVPSALAQVTKAQHLLSRTQHRLSLLPFGPADRGHPLTLLAASQLARDQRQLTQDQRRLARAVDQLARAVRQVAQSGSAQRAQRASDSHRLLVDSAIALAIVLALALLGGWLVAGRMLRPIRTMTRTARRISSSSLHERLALDGPQDELKELGDTLDDLFARLEAAFVAQRNFVANAAHELRTPLTRERTLVQIALDDPSTPDVWRSAGGELLASNREQETLIEALLTLASSESGIDRHERVDLADICETVLARSRPGDGLQLQIETDVRPSTLDGDSRLIERLVANLVDNAIGHNVAGGRIRISTDTTGGHAVLSVANSGPAVTPGDVDRLFQPFQRLDGQRTHHKDGHGLGLSIVRAIAAAHHATITARPRPEGGLSVSVTFPAHQ